MPLLNNPWEQGKCGFKLIQYMACEKPVIGSPVGVNCEIIKHGINGFLAKNISDWKKYLLVLKKSKILRGKMRKSGREIVEKNFVYK